MRPTQATPTNTRVRGSAHVRLRVALVAIAMVASFFGARLVQLQGMDPHAYAAAAKQEGLRELVLPARRGDILDRNGEPLATTAAGRMIIADPTLTASRAPALAKFLADRLAVDYADTLEALRKPDSRFAYIARRVPTSTAMDVLAEAEREGFVGLTSADDPIRDYPNKDVAANLVGFLNTDGDPLAGMEMQFDDTLSGTDGTETFEIGSGGKRIPLGENSVVEPTDGHDLHLTIDRDVQWFAQKALAQAIHNRGAKSGSLVVMDTLTGRIIAAVDVPTYDASAPGEAPAEDRGARSVSDPYEPGSVEKTLTMSALIDAGKVTPRTKLSVPSSINVDGFTIHDYFDHPTLDLTLTGVLSKSSNLGTLKAASLMSSARLRGYLASFGLGQRTNVGITGESAGVLPDAADWTDLTRATASFGQGISVTAVQMAAAINAIANGGVYVSPSIVEGDATTDGGDEVGTDTSSSHRVISQRAASDVASMMERVIDGDAGTAPLAGVPGYRVAGKTGTAQLVNPKTKAYYDNKFIVSFAGFAPADKPRFTAYVVVKEPGSGGGAGVAGPVFSQVMAHVLRRYGVTPTNTPPSNLPACANGKNRTSEC